MQVIFWIFFRVCECYKCSSHFSHQMACSHPGFMATLSRVVATLDSTVLSLLVPEIGRKNPVSSIKETYNLQS